ncbi:hypothetical protein ABNB90_15440 [Paenibacillus larvae]
MNIVEMYRKVKEIYEANVRTPDNWETGYEFIGLRFEDKEREIGEICKCSRHNADREDEREFPDYGTDEYWEMEKLDGTSAWDMAHENTYEYSAWDAEQEDCRRCFLTEHCYVIAGNNVRNHSDADYGEIVIEDAVVIAKIF